jgi:hypothetical protein
MSDLFATQDGRPAANGGNDLVMPGPGAPYGVRRTPAELTPCRGGVQDVQRLGLAPSQVTGPHPVQQRSIAHMGRVVIGMDPHKRSATIEIINDREKVLALGRYGTDTSGYSVAVAGLAARAYAKWSRTMPRSCCGCWSTAARRARTETVSRIHHLLLELIPGGRRNFLTRGEAGYLVRTALPPVGIGAQTRHDLARELIEELSSIDAKVRAVHHASSDSRCRSRLPSSPPQPARPARGPKPPGRSRPAPLGVRR